MLVPGFTSAAHLTCYVVESPLSPINTKGDEVHTKDMSQAVNDLRFAIVSLSHSLVYGNDSTPLTFQPVSLDFALFLHSHFVRISHFLRRKITTEE